MNTTVIYITDNCINEEIDLLCRNHILSSIGELPLISVSHKPMDFGHNICVGELDRNSLSINIQIMKALDIAETKYIAIAEHDVLYTPEHFTFIPPDNESWYNENVWMLQYYSKDNPQFNGMFSQFKQRKANSQLICSTETMISSTQDRIDMMGDPAWFRKYPSGRIGEAGAMDYKHAMRLATGDSVSHIREALKKYINRYKGYNWNSTLPNVDIRHNMNFTKNRRGVHRRYDIPHWGTMENIFNERVINTNTSP